GARTDARTAGVARAREVPAPRAAGGAGSRGLALPDGPRPQADARRRASAARTAGRRVVCGEARPPRGGGAVGGYVGRPFQGRRRLTRVLRAAPAGATCSGPPRCDE